MPTIPSKAGYAAHTQRAPRCVRQSGPAAARTAVRPTSSPPTSRAPPGNGIPAGAARLAVAAARRGCPHEAAVTHGDTRTNANRRPALVWPPGERLPCSTEQVDRRSRRRGFLIHFGQGDLHGGGAGLSAVGALVPDSLVPLPSLNSAVERWYGTGRSRRRRARSDLDGAVGGGGRPAGRARRLSRLAAAVRWRGTGPRSGSRWCVPAVAAERRCGLLGCPVSEPAAPIGLAGLPIAHLRQWVAACAAVAIHTGCLCPAAAHRRVPSPAVPALSPRFALPALTPGRPAAARRRHR